MNKHEVRYRLEVNYLSKDYDDWALAESSPIYTKKEGIAKYQEAVKEFCVDDRSKPARVWLWKYEPRITILKNY